MARMRNQNSGPDTAITASDSNAPRTFDASMSDSDADTSNTPSRTSKPITAQYFTRHIPAAATTNTAQTTNAPPAVGSSPRTSKPAR